MNECEKCVTFISISKSKIIRILIVILKYELANIKESVFVSVCSYKWKCVCVCVFPRHNYICVEISTTHLLRGNVVNQPVLTATKKKKKSHINYLC